ncbi:uncharacterized protein LOC114541416 [Dendronephthya gigantea]|uniref:uncharacterized protein LOC114541416 n=1 Tax=Dendronephthya gigantea TaxID=151771 RepID=UPI00106D2442|nr:uncharacterized protein LOC114541416 [Dendronephthya gigantea]
MENVEKEETRNDSNSTISVTETRSTEVEVINLTDETSNCKENESDSSSSLEVVSIVHIKSEPNSDSSDSEISSSGDMDDSSGNDLPSSGINDIHYYNDDKRLPVYRYGLTEGMPTKVVVRQLLNIDNETRVATTVPCSVQHNSAFIVDSWCLDDPWDVKSDDMGSWTNQGRKRFKNGTIAENYDTYRQSYTHADLTSLKKYLIYLENANSLYRYMYVQYVFTQGETQVTLRPHGSARNDKRPYKRTMASTIRSIREKDAKPRKIMHEIITERGGIEQISSSGEYPRNRSQIYRARNSSTPTDNSYQSNDPLVQLLQISK